VASLPVELREQTRALHDALDRALPLMSASLTRPQYVDTLSRMHAWWAPTERRVSSLLSERFSLTLRERAGALRRDLDALGVSIPDSPDFPDFPDVPAVPPLTCEAHAVGAFYVLEGSALGAPFISRHLSETLGITPATGGSFFGGTSDGDRAATGRRWRDVQSALEQYPADDVSSVVDGARRTFASLHAWLT
jgi:heme oxygenase (biliverdin-IX-beta and delta-forming)